MQDISIGHQQGPRWLCSAASSYTEAVTLLFYKPELLNSVVCTQSLEQFVDIFKDIAATQQSCDCILKEEYLIHYFRTKLDLDQGTKRVQKLLMRDIKWPCLFCLSG